VTPGSSGHGFAHRGHRGPGKASPPPATS